jgi:hypothetical protein
MLPVVALRKALLLLWGPAIVLVLTGCKGKPGPWTSHATFTVVNRPVGTAPDLAGTYTAADSTVPRTEDGNAELAPMGGLPPTIDFIVTIGDVPGQGINVSQFVLLLPNYHGAGGYAFTAKDGNAALDVGARGSFNDHTNSWTTEDSRLTACAVEVSADIATHDATIRQIRGSFTCHAMHDSSQHTNAAAVHGHFDVFAEAWCAYGKTPARSHPTCRAQPAGVPNNGDS